MKGRHENCDIDSSAESWIHSMAVHTGHGGRVECSVECGLGQREERLPGHHHNQGSARADRFLCRIPQGVFPANGGVQLVRGTFYRLLSREVSDDPTIANLGWVPDKRPPEEPKVDWEQRRDRIGEVRSFSASENPWAHNSIRMVHCLKGHHQVSQKHADFWPIYRWQPSYLPPAYEWSRA